MNKTMKIRSSDDFIAQPNPKMDYIIGDEPTLNKVDKILRMFGKIYRRSKARWQGNKTIYFSVVYVN